MITLHLKLISIEFKILYKLVKHIQLTSLKFESIKLEIVTDDLGNQINKK